MISLFCVIWLTSIEYLFFRNLLTYFFLAYLQSMMSYTKNLKVWKVNTNDQWNIKPQSFQGSAQWLYVIPSYLDDTADCTEITSVFLCVRYITSYNTKTIISVSHVTTMMLHSSFQIIIKNTIVVSCYFHDTNKLMVLFIHTALC